jgi:cob(I)alamin adenosyltransferase
LTNSLAPGEKKVHCEKGARVFLPGFRLRAVRKSLAAALALSGVAAFFASPIPARADVQVFETRATPFFTIDELRIGGFRQAIDDAPHEGGPALNLEVLFGRWPGGYENRILELFMTPRPHIGTTISLNGKTSEFYFGDTWDFKLTDWAFIEASFGGAAHDGPLDELGHASYGCRLNFRESGSLGFKLSEDWRLLFTLDHMSNAGLCNPLPNRGLTNAGARIGYKF